LVERVEIDRGHKSIPARAHTSAARASHARSAPGAGEELFLPLPGRKNVVVDRFDDFHRPHLIDRGVEQQDEEVERDDRAEESDRAAENGIEGSVHGREGD
jgi:hypothetical protein